MNSETKKKKIESKKKKKKLRHTHGERDREIEQSKEMNFISLVQCVNLAAKGIILNFL